jgi:hypothetical protein
MDEIHSEEFEPRIDRSQFSVARLGDRDDTLDYWLSRTMTERLEALERLRRISYGETAATARIERVLEVVRRAYSWAVQGYVPLRRRLLT